MLTSWLSVNKQITYLFNEIDFKPQLLHLLVMCANKIKTSENGFTYFGEIITINNKLCIFI